jgi:hypothetical protein
MLMHDELKQAAQPLIDILYNYGNPHSIIIVQQDSVEILSGEMAVPIEVRD